MKQAWINQKELAKRLELTPQRIRAMHDEGLEFKKEGRENLYPWPKTREWYADRKEEERRARAENAGRRGGGSEIEKEARARKMAAQARLAEIELAKAQAALIPMTVHEEIVTQLAERLVAAIKNLPQSWAKQLTAIDDPRKVAKVLRKVSAELVEDLRSVFDDELDTD